MSTTTCPRCGAPMREGDGESACPACLMSGALRPEPENDAAGYPRDFGGYRLLAVLGSGGMGTVYEAEHLSTGRRVALKMLDLQFDDAELRQRFLREGRLAASVNHENSLYIFGSEEIGKVPVITMEIACGGTLQDRLDKHGPLPVTEAVDGILDVVAGLEAAHAAGVLHRDVKPSNCFVDPDGTVKIGDFGLSVSTLPRDDTYITATGVVLGTPAFAPPEQLQGDELDLRADIYSVGATLFTLLTGRAPFLGDNVVQVVANVIHGGATCVRALRSEVPAELARVVARCLSREKAQRYPDYRTLRDDLLPFGSKEPAPASMLLRAPAGWVDFLVALLPAYLALMLVVGAEKLIVRPLVERTLWSARYHVVLLGCAIAYFTVAEGIGGAGLGKWLKGLRVVDRNGRRPGVGRALVRILLPLFCVEAVRIPLTMLFIADADWSGFETTMFVVAAIVGGAVPVGLAWTARMDNAYATPWDRASGTRVVVRPRGAARPRFASTAELPEPPAAPERLGPYEIVGEPAPGTWLLGTDPVLRRPVWLLRRGSSAISLPRRKASRPGRLRWLQDVDGAWDAFEAPRGAPLAGLVEGGKHVRWGTMRYWLHDLASELWVAAHEGTLPAELGLDHVWIAADGRAILLDEAWPEVRASAEPFAVADIGGRQRFLAAIAACVEPTEVPLHARRVLRNLEEGRFEKLTYLAGALRGLLDRPVEVTRAIRAGSIFLLPLYVWTAVVVGRYHDKPWDDPAGILVNSALVVLGAFALIQLLALAFRATAGQALFRVAVVDAEGAPASRPRLLARWAIVWLPLAVPVALLVSVGPVAAGATLVLWVCMAPTTVVRPRRGLHDRWAGTWVVRR